MAWVYDGARAVFLSSLLSLVLCGAQEPPDGWFKVAAAGADVAAGTVARVDGEARAALASLRPAFPGLPRQPFRIIVHGSAADLPAPLQADHHEGSPGFALLGRHEIHVLVAESRQTVDGFGPVLQHELTHELVDQLVAPWGRRVPRWLHEGLAQVLAGGTYLGASEENIVWRAAVDQLLPFSSLEDDFPREPVQLRLAYAQSFSYVAWLERTLGRSRLLALVDEIDGETSFLRALVLATQRTTAELEESWRDYLLHRSGAGFRALLNQCFSILMLFAVPLLALAVRRRLRVERQLRQRLEREELAEAAAVAEPTGDDQ